ncbi:MAG: phosphatidate cytidylyltransferase [Rhodospirillales bacterium]|nr:phosphatidate cytidylyltransferase [Rhodospirillales bacterium]
MELAIPQTVAVTLGTLFTVLVFSHLIAFVLKKANPKKDYSELFQRINSWWVIIIIFAVAVVMERTAAIIFLGFVSFLALKEFFSLIPTRRADRRVLFWAYLSVPLQFYWVYDYWYGMFIIFIPVWIFLFLPLRMLVIGTTDGFLKAAGTIHWGLMITVFNLSHAAYFLSLPAIDNPQAGGVGLLLFLVILTQFNDVAQYVWGKSLGKTKIVPKSSPGKTWAGFLGGVVTTGAAAYFIAPYLTPLEGGMGAIGGAIIAVAGFIGDVTVSAIKRDLGVKDSSSFIPGHGGILDRVDSLTFSAPVFFHFIFYLYYGPTLAS